MNPELLLTIAVQVAVGLYVYGRLTERVKVHTEELKEHGERIADHGERISAIEGALPCLTMGAKAGR